MMKVEPFRFPLWPLALFFLMLNGGVFLAAAEEPPLPNKFEGAQFQQAGSKDGRQRIVGRMGLHRQFLGTRAETAFKDMVQFHFYNDDRLRSLFIENSELEGELIERLATGHSLPVLATVRCEWKIVGHDGINQSKVLTAYLEAYEEIHADAICEAAEGAGFEAAQSAQFRNVLKLDYEKNGVVVRLGTVTAREKVNPRVAALGIQGIQIFNAKSEALTYELLTVEVQQGEVSQFATLRKAEEEPSLWPVEGNSWTNGLYRPGKMPVVLRLFDLAEPLVAGEGVSVNVKMKLSNGEEIVLSESVEVL